MFSANTPQGSTVSVTTQTFYSSTTWVAPAGVTSISTLVGKGQDGTSGGYSSDLVGQVRVAVFVTPGSYDPPPPDWSNIGGSLDWSAPYGNEQSFLSDLNSGAPSVRSKTYYFCFYQYYGTPYNAWYTTGVRPNIGVTIQGYATANSTPPSSGVIPISSNIFNSYLISADTYHPGSAGSSTTGFGYTFAGGAADTAATPVTYNNVAVTPGASYSLSIPSGGYIQITYAS